MELAPDQVTAFSSPCSSLPPVRPDARLKTVMGKWILAMHRAFSLHGTT